MGTQPLVDRKSTRLNSSHRCNSYAVFCLKKKNQKHAAKSHHKSHVTRRKAQNLMEARVCQAFTAACSMLLVRLLNSFFFFNNRAPPEISPFPPHGLLPI